MFVAVLIPTILKPAGDAIVLQIGTGLVVNAGLVGLFLGAKALWDRR